MKQRLFSNWTFVRVVYFILGTLILVPSIIMGQWIGILLGGYFASMGLFAFGCAAGSCSTATYRRKQKLKPENEIDYKEIK